MHTWADIPGLEGHYQASDLGRIRSVKGSKPRLLNPKPGPKGRLRVLLYAGGQRTRMNVHKAVLLAFVGPCPDGLEACHGERRTDWTPCGTAARATP